MTGISIDARVQRNRLRMCVVTLCACALLTTMFLLIIAPIGVLLGGGFAKSLPMSVGLALFGASIVTGAQLASTPSRVLDRIGARPLEAQHVELEHLMAGLAIAAGVPAVVGALIEDPAPNAIAIGRTPASTTIAVTTGLVQLLPRAEVEAIIAVEMAAVSLHEVALGTYAFACAGSTVELANMWL
ncbi:MAG TPA: M48 family metalloprotease, partial [Acidimicrobiia bacterium]|nr:M48 family metalloprotease [Acidimicrobiia bacterium]